MTFKKPAIISLKTIYYRLVFIMVTACVLCEVGT